MQNQTQKASSHKYFSHFTLAPLNITQGKEGLLISFTAIRSMQSIYAYSRDNLILSQQLINQVRKFEYKLIRITQNMSRLTHSQLEEEDSELKNLKTLDEAPDDSLMYKALNFTSFGRNNQKPSSDLFELQQDNFRKLKEKRDQQIRLSLEKFKKENASELFAAYKDFQTIGEVSQSRGFNSSGSENED